MIDKSLLIHKLSSKKLSNVKNNSVITFDGVKGSIKGTNFIIDNDNTLYIEDSDNNKSKGVINIVDKNSNAILISSNKPTITLKELDSREHENFKIILQDGKYKLIATNDYLEEDIDRLSLEQNGLMTLNSNNEKVLEVFNNNINTNIILGESSNYSYINYNKENKKLQLGLNDDNIENNKCINILENGFLGVNIIPKYNLDIKGSFNLVDSDYNLTSNSLSTLHSLKLVDNVSLECLGYSKLGENAPKIKMKVLRGTTSSSEGGNVNIRHNLNNSKILSINIIVNNNVKSNHRARSDYECDIYINGSYINVKNIYNNSRYILSKQFKLIIIYEE